jgi:hypothetical protein
MTTRFFLQLLDIRALLLQTTSVVDFLARIIRISQDFIKSRVCIGHLENLASTLLKISYGSPLQKMGSQTKALEDFKTNGGFMIYNMEMNIENLPSILCNLVISVLEKHFRECLFNEIQSLEIDQKPKFDLKPSTEFPKDVTNFIESFKPDFTSEFVCSRNDRIILDRIVQALCMKRIAIAWYHLGGAFLEFSEFTFKQAHSLLRDVFGGIFEPLFLIECIDNVACAYFCFKQVGLMCKENSIDLNFSGLKLDLKNNKPQSHTCGPNPFFDNNRCRHCGESPNKNGVYGSHTGSIAYTIYLPNILGELETQMWGKNSSFPFFLTPLQDYAITPKSRSSVPETKLSKNLSISTTNDFFLSTVDLISRRLAPYGTKRLKLSIGKNIFESDNDKFWNQSTKYFSETLDILVLVKFAHGNSNFSLLKSEDVKHIYDFLIASLVQDELD